jgi:outer membrane protein assembly factor BamB
MSRRRPKSRTNGRIKFGPLRRLAVMLFGATVFVMSAQANAADWPQFHFAADRSGFNPAETTLNASNVSELVLSWSRTISAAPVTPPVVADGVVYAGSNDGNVYALNASTGAILWKGAAGVSVPTPPAVAAGRVFVGSDDAKVSAFPTSCSTPCAPVWVTTAAGGISASLAVANDVLYVGSSRVGGGELAALDVATGSVLWQAPLDLAPDGVAVANGIVYASDGGSLYAFPASCSTPCAPLWLAQFAGGLPAVGAGTVFIDAGYVNFFNAFPATASCSTPCPPLWTAVTNAGTRRAPAIAGGSVYLSEGDGTLAAFPVSCSTPCAPSWTAAVGGFVSDPAVANGVVYVGTDNRLAMFNGSTGAQLFSIPTGAGALSPAIVNGTVFVSLFDFTSGGRVNAYALSVADTTPPVITVPAPITVNATSPNGAVVTYSVSATDPDDAVASLTCAPPSGSTFPIGTTTVHCTATDTHGNTSAASFTVHVNGAADQLADLVVQLAGIGPGTSLADKVELVQAYLAANDVRDACSTMRALINEVKALSGKTIPPAEAATLIATANRITSVLGC